MKKYIYPMALAATTLLATACSDKEIVDDIQNIPDSQKEMISFSLSDGTTNTRAGFTGADTRIVARIQSDKKGTTDILFTRTVLKATKDATGGADDFSVVSYYTSDNTRYWDDAFGRLGQISVYAVAIPNSTSDSKLTDAKLAGGSTWASEATPNNTIAWSVTADQSSNPLASEDLVYSNNIQDGGTDGRYVWDYTISDGKEKGYPANTGATSHKAGRLVFTQKDSAQPSDAGHFDKGHLVFKHSLSRITITLSAGEGFESKPFEFASGTNIKLLGMNVSGNLNIKNGVWNDISTADISKLAKTTSETNAAGTYMAQMLPGYSFGKESPTNVLEFTIDNNVYYITQKMLFEALTYDKDNDGVYDSGDGDGALVSMKGESSITMEQGKNYQFKIKVNKKQIESITATLADWVKVEAADQSMDNAHVQFTFAAPTGTNCTEFQFYRLKEALTGCITTEPSYTAESFSGDYKNEGAATIEAMTGASGKYQATGWFYDDNKTAYHFRTLNALAADEEGTDGADKSENIKNVSDKSVFTMKAGAESKDYHWGAPMKTDPTQTESYSSTEGFKNCIHKGVISTTSDLKITELHMMSNIYITLKTTTGSNQVDLSGATVTLTQLSTEATVDMGIGLVTPLDPVSPTTWASATQSTNEVSGCFSCAAIPQILVRGDGPTHTDTDYVGITITTSDGNKYYIVKELSDLTANLVTGGHKVEEGFAIERWYPGHKYYYTFTITKKGIENITCTVADWISVTAAEKDLDLES